MKHAQSGYKKRILIPILVQPGRVDGGVFSNITMQSLIGNPGLCGAPSLGFSHCHGKLHKNTRHRTYPAATVAFGSALLCVCLMIRRKLKSKGEAKSFVVDHSDIVDQRIISYHDLVHATANLSSSYKMMLLATS